MSAPYITTSIRLLISGAAMLLAMGLPCAGLAHTSSTAYLHIDASVGTAVPLTWRIALRDLDALLDLDANLDGRLTWGEVEDGEDDILAMALRSLRVEQKETECPLAFESPRFVRLDGNGFVSMAGQASCPQAVSAIRLDYRFFAGIDPSHRVLVSTPQSAQPLLLSPGSARVISVMGSVVETGAARTENGFGALFAQGVTHILGGFDHILFLVALLLPATMTRRNGSWVACVALAPALGQVARIVTAFTVAHSMTLALASFGLLRISSAVIEPMIAASILAAALNNLRPVLRQHLVWAAFAFGLIHGFGFAEVLAPLELTAADLALALAAFNLGVEGGQLLIVAVVMAPLAAARGWRHYPRWVLGAGSIGLALIACGWMVERLFDVPVFALG
ncbi:MAG: HupE/UreJ family protein [Burkholderiales bacterium]